MIRTRRNTTVSVVSMFGPEEDVLAKNELIRIKYGRMYDRITFDD